jgi:hypothetical protein
VTTTTRRRTQGITGIQLEPEGEHGGPGPISGRRGVDAVAGGPVTADSMADISSSSDDRVPVKAAGRPQVNDDGQGYSPIDHR